MKKRDLRRLQAFGPDYAVCEGCELQPQCEKGRVALAYRPKAFNGLMIVGEGPGQQEVVAGRPFVGKAGQLLALIMESIGIDLDECYITNATVCKPPPQKNSFEQDFPHAIESCLPRLEAEIEAVRPQVIVPLGAIAWKAVSGYDDVLRRNVEFDCEHCNEQRKVGPVFQCTTPVPDAANGGSTLTACGYVHFFNASSPLEVDPEEVATVKEEGCPKCGGGFKRLRPKMIKCLHCGGRKRRLEEYTVFKADYSITQAAGAIFEPHAGGDAPMAAHHLMPWLADCGVKYVVPTFHPAHILRGQSFLTKAVQKHLQKALRLLEGGRPISFEYDITSDPVIVREFIDSLRPKDGSPFSLSVDIETVAIKDGEAVDARAVRNVTGITCIGLGNTSEALVVDTRECDPSDPDDPLLEVIAEVLTDPQIHIGYHHGAGYDVIVNDRVWGIPWEDQVATYSDDSMFAHINLYPDEPQRLDHVTAKFVDAFAWKPPRTVKGVEVHGDFEELALYNARDVVHTAHNIAAMGVCGGKAIPGGRMARAGLERVYEQDSKIRKIAIGMTMRGMPLDTAVWATMGDTAQQHIDGATQRAKEALRDAKHPEWETFNVNSYPQLRKLLFGPESYFKLPVIKATKTGASVDKTVFQELLSITDAPTIVKFLQAKLELLKHTYVAKNFVFSEKMQPWEDGRIHPIWQPWGARTGRFTSSPNAQNWPHWLRGAIVTADGRVIVGSDYDQLELRGMAFLSQDKNLIQRCLNADDKRKLEPECDPHSYVASLAFGARYTELNLKDPAHDPSPGTRCRCQTCERKTLRDICKRVIYGLNYGAGDQRVLEAIYEAGYSGPPITLDMIALVRLTIFKAFPGILAWRNEQVERAKGLGELRSPLYNRRRIFPLAGSAFGDEIPVTEIYNYPIQSLGADIMNEQIILLNERLPAVDPTAFIFAQVHDAIYIEASADRAEPVAELLSDTLTVELTRDGVTMPFTAGAKIKTNWKEAA